MAPHEHHSSAFYRLRFAETSVRLSSEFNLSSRVGTVGLKRSYSIPRIVKALISTAQFRTQDLFAHIRVEHDIMIILPGPSPGLGSDAGTFF